MEKDISDIEIQNKSETKMRIGNTQLFSHKESKEESNNSLILSSLLEKLSNTDFTHNKDL